MEETRNTLNSCAHFKEKRGRMPIDDCIIFIDYIATERLGYFRYVGRSKDFIIYIDTQWNLLVGVKEG